MIHSRDKVKLSVEEKLRVKLESICSRFFDTVVSGKEMKIALQSGPIIDMEVAHKKMTTNLIILAENQIKMGMIANIGIKPKIEEQERASQLPSGARTPVLRDQLKKT